MNIFKGMSWSEIGIVVILGTLSAVVVALLEPRLFNHMN